MEFRLVLFRSGRAVGISGKDANFVTASKVQRTTRDPGSLIEQAVDLGFVGEPSKVDRSLLDTLSAAGMIPVVAPIGVGTDGATYNIKADTMAGAVAAAVGASRLFLLTDVPAVLDRQRSAERREGKGWGRTGTSRCARFHYKNKRKP